MDDRKPSRLSNVLLGVYRLYRAAYWALKPSPLACEISRELCSLPQRIGTLRATKSYLYGIEIGPLGGIRGRELRYKQTLACIRDMRHIAQSHPWANLLDRGLFVEGWNLGAKWALDETCTLNSDKARIDELTSNHPPDTSTNVTVQGK
jgi:hypothetical protein